MQGPSCKVYQMQERMENAQFNSQNKFTEKKKINFLAECCSLNRNKQRANDLFWVCDKPLSTVAAQCYMFSFSVFTKGHTHLHDNTLN